jgi:DNA-binding NarL/FixJ family response regulator
VAVATWERQGVKRTKVDQSRGDRRARQGHTGAVRAVRCPILVGRGEELELLTELLVDASEGRGGAAFVLGEPGIGKSRLLATLGEIARTRNMAVLRGRAAPSPVPVPYRPLAEAFLSAMRGRDADVEDLDRFRAVLPVLLPGSASFETDADASVVLLGEAVLALAQRCRGPGGVLILLEDLHWADTETCALLDYLSDKLDSTSTALVASVRTGEASDAEHLAHTLTARRHAASVLLRRLDPDAVTALICASLGTAVVPERVRATVADASGGVPLLIEEFLASLIEADALWREGDRWRATERLPGVVPASFAALVADRLATLSARARQVLDAAAVIGDQIDHGLVASVTDLDEAATIEALREAVRTQLVDEVSTGSSREFRFHHGLSRAAVLDQLSEPRRRELARGALSALEARRRGPSTDHLHLAGRLALAAGDMHRAVRALVAAGEAAVRQGACRSAWHAAELAAELATSDDELVEALEVLLDASVESGDSARAVEVSRRLLELLERVDPEPRRLALVHVRLADAAVAATDWEGAERHLLDAMALSDDLGADVHARVHLLRTSIALGRHVPGEAAEHAARAMAAATESHDAARVAEAAMLLGRAHRVADVEAARRAFTDAVEAAHRAGSRVLIARAAHELATLDVLEGGPPERMQEARRLADEAGALALAATCDAHLAILHWLHFDLDASRACAQRALDAALRYDLRLLIPASAVRVASDAVLGRDAEAVELFDRYRPMMDAEIEATSRGHVLAVRALAREERGEALDQLERAAGLAPPYSDVARAPHSGLRALLLAVARERTAPSVVGQLDRDPAVVGVARALVDLALAVLDGRTGDRAEAGRQAELAFSALRDKPWFRAMALRLVAEAAIEDGWGQPAAWLRAAHDFFYAAGMEAPAAACHRLLRQAGAPAPRQPVRGQHPELARLGVTPRESEVLFLVAAGLSNRDIAERLVLSVRTVEKHVERLMVKTSTANRTQLAALANRMVGPAPATT